MTIYGVSRSTVKNWRKRKIIHPYIEIGNVVRFDLIECEQRLAGYVPSGPTKRY